MGIITKRQWQIRDLIKLATQNLLLFDNVDKNNIVEKKYKNRAISNSLASLFNHVLVREDNFQIATHLFDF